MARRMAQSSIAVVDLGVCTFNGHSLNSIQSVTMGVN